MEMPPKTELKELSAAKRTLSRITRQSHFLHGRLVFGPLKTAI
jgi:hypothetical protein